MSRCQLTEKQKTMLRSIIPGLKDGSVKTEWIISYGDNRILGIFGLDDDGSLWRNVWNGVRHADFDDFIECGLFRQTRVDKYGVPTNYSLHSQRIIELVDINFGEPMVEKNVESEAKDSRAVFVVHGRNEAIREAFFDFLRSIGLRPLEWSDLVKRTGKSTPYIGEILDTAFSEAQAIVVLMTPDDEARLCVPYRKEHEEQHEINLTPQARANVLFEAGIAMGRSPDRTLLVQIGKIRPFSDIAGRHVIRLDNSTEKRQEIAQRLIVAGCLVDLNGTDWHRKGDFKIDLPATTEENPIENHWGKSGNLWWLFGDLTATWNWLDRGSKGQIIDGLKRCHHHANQLGMTDRNIVGRLYQLMTDADGYSDPDWTRSIRDQFLRRLESVRNDAGQIAQAKQIGFVPDPE